MSAPPTLTSTDRRSHSRRACLPSTVSVVPFRVVSRHPFRRRRTPATGNVGRNACRVGFVCARHLTGRADAQVSLRAPNHRSARYCSITSPGSSLRGGRGGQSLNPEVFLLLRRMSEHFVRPSVHCIVHVLLYIDPTHAAVAILQRHPISYVRCDFAHAFLFVSQISFFFVQLERFTCP